MKPGKALRQARIEKGMSQRELAEAVGVAQTNVSQWERGRATPRPAHLKRLSKVLARPMSTFLTAEEPEEGEQVAIDSTAMLPLIATVPMGDPQEAIETTDEFVRVTPAEAAQSDFVFRVVGSSMWPYFWDGDMVGVKLATSAEDRQIVIARLENGESTLKQFRRDPVSGDAWLEPLNKSLRAIRGDFAVRGIVVWIRKALPGGRLPGPA